MSLLSKVTGISFKTKGAAPGKAVIIKTGSGAGQEREIEMYHSPGDSSAPTENDRIIEIPVGSGVRVAIASHNYRIEVEATPGERIIYSTNSDGSAVKAKIKLDNDGKITIEGDSDITLNGDTKTFVTHAELNTALQTFITSLNSQLGLIAGGATAAVAASGLWLTPLTIGGLSLDISAAETTTIKTGG